MLRCFFTNDDYKCSFGLILKQYCEERVITKIERDDNVTPNKIIWNSSNSFVW